MIALTFSVRPRVSVKHACTVLPERGLTGTVFSQNKTCCYGGVIETVCGEQHGAMLQW